MKRFFKIFLSMLIVILMTFGCMTSAFAEYNFSVLEKPNVVIRLTHEESLKFKAYTASDFAEVNAVDVYYSCLEERRDLYMAELAKQNQVDFTKENLRIEDFYDIFADSEIENWKSSDLLSYLKSNMIFINLAKDKKEKFTALLEEYIEEKSKSLFGEFNPETYRACLTIIIDSDDKDVKSEAANKLKEKDWIESANVVSVKFVSDEGVIPGDVNKDGEINITDVTAIQKHIAQLNVFETDYQYKAADVNRDGVVNIADATEIQRKITGII